jgi:hypothetical protein
VAAGIAALAEPDASKIAGGVARDTEFNSVGCQAVT